MNIEEAKEAYEGLKKNAFIVESINKEFFFKFGETVLNELEKYEKQLDLDYVENELDKKDKIINEMIEELVNRTYVFTDKDIVIDFFTKKVEGK